MACFSPRRAADLLLLTFLALALAPFAGSPAAADDFPYCGDGICDPFDENNQNCPADCPVCGDGICGYKEPCGSCVSDCTDSCVTLSLSGPLKQSGCLNDDDNDCLDNFREEDLAWIFSPHYFYDEDEDCAGAWYTDGPNPLHFGRKDFFQLRPQGGSQPYYWENDGTKKRVDITYFLLHPHDCRSTFGTGGHLGDSEHVVFHLQSTDLRTWVLTSADYYHHGRVHTFSGKYIKARANEIGTSYPSIAADEDSHGSWPGRRGWSSDCAGSEDSFCATTCDCFRGSMESARQANYREYLSTYRNIGGPYPESFRNSVVAVLGSYPNQTAYSAFDVGHGLNLEYWTEVSGHFNTFCGWECYWRTSDGNCEDFVHGRFNCVNGLWQKVDDDHWDFTAPPSLNSLPDPGYEMAATEALRAEITQLITGLSFLPASEIDDWLSRVEVAADPVSLLVPLAKGRSRELQLETLRWMYDTGSEKWEAAFAPGVLPPDRLTGDEVTELAGGLLTSLVHALGGVVADPR